MLLIKVVQSRVYLSLVAVMAIMAVMALTPVYALVLLV